MNSRCLKIAVTLTIVACFVCSTTWGFKDPKDFFDRFKNWSPLFSLDQLRQWRNDPDNALKKKVQDFAGCPSNDAQALYNSLKDIREKARQARDAAQGTLNDAQSVLGACKGMFPDGTVPTKSGPKTVSPCQEAYDLLVPEPKMKDILGWAQNAMNRLDDAMKLLKSLKCIAGCDQAAKIVIPWVSLESGQTRVLYPILGTVKAGLENITAAMTNIMRPVVGGPQVASLAREIDVCTQWDPGSFSINFDAGSGEISAGVRAKLPKCLRAEHISLVGHWCSPADWDITILLPKLKELRLVPPEVIPVNIRVQIPTRQYHIVSGFSLSACSQPVKICRRGSATFTIGFDLGADPLSILRSVSSANCAEWVEIGCSQPPFGLTPTYTDVTVPDPSSGSISWSGAKISPGGTKVDLTKPEFSAACRGGSVPSIPKAPTYQLTSSTLEIPYMCNSIRWANVVANP